MVPSNVFEIPEDTAFQLFDVGESRLDHDGAGFLAPNASCAKHNDWFIFHWVGKGSDGLRKGSERPYVEVNGVLERSDT